jgi:hypothetical protein
MPIKPENKSRYPKNWKEISEFIRFERADNMCEFCGAINHSFVNRKTRELCLKDEDDSIQIILTVAHLDHNPENCNPDNLKALCQKCHNNYDQKHRKETRRFSKMKNQLSLSL